MFDWRDIHEAWSDDEESSAMQVTPSSHERMKLLLEKTRGLERAHQVSFKYGDEGENEEEEEDEIELETFSDDARLEQRDRVKDITMSQIKSEARDLQLAGDLQGIPWERLHFSRAHYRTMRLRSYRNYVNVLGEDANEWRDDIKKKAHPQVTSVGGRCGGFYTFGRSHRVVNHTIVHFQLRNLVWASSHNDVYTVYENCLRHYSPSLAPPLSSSFPPSSSSPPLKTLLDLSGGPLTPSLGINSTGGGGGVQISTLCVKDGWIAIGGFGGELILLRSKDINTRHDEVEIKGRISPPTFSTRLGRSDNGITNGIDIAGLGAGCSISPSLLSSNNDCLIRLLDLETFQLKHSRTFEWAINYGTMRPGGEALVAVVGDDPVTHLTDMTSGKTIAKLECHQDYSFACAWHPGGILLATGNQDTTAAVWDIRKTKEPLSRLVGSMGAIRSIRFSPDGRFMVMVEPADFVHIVDVHSCFTRVQQVDFFGEIAGCSFTGEEDASSSLFIGIADMTYNSLLEYSRSSEEEEREAEREVAQSRAAAREARGLEDAVSESEDEEMEDMEEEEGFVVAGEDQAEEGEGGQEVEEGGYEPMVEAAEEPMVEEGGYEPMVEAAEEPMAIAQEEEEPWGGFWPVVDR